MVDITVDLPQLGACIRGTVKRTRSLAEPRLYQSGTNETPENLRAALSEYAVCIALDRKWIPGSIGYASAGANKYQVEAQWCHYQEPQLVVDAEDPIPTPIVLVTQMADEWWQQRVLGWQWSHIVRREGHRDPARGGYWLPAGQLRQISVLKQHMVSDTLGFTDDQTELNERRTRANRTVRSGLQQP